MSCAYKRPRYQVSVCRTIAPLVKTDMIFSDNDCISHEAFTSERKIFICHLGKWLPLCQITNLSTETENNY